MKHAIGPALLSLFAACVADPADPPEVSTTAAELAGAPAGAIAVPADYDGDGYTDFAMKSASGIWYIDLANCAPGHPGAVAEKTCTGDRDEDFDSVPGAARINDGCPTYGTGAAAGPETACDDDLDNDGDGRVNDGCPAFGVECSGGLGFGGRWDLVYWGYGNATARPLPHDYGRVDNSVDPHRQADLAIYDTVTGRWSIDYADNGYGAFDRVVNHTLLGEPVPADYDGDLRTDLAVKTASGLWRIDVASDGFGTYIGPSFNYGGSTMQVAPGDYDGDGCADIAVKDPNAGYGTWRIDYAASLWFPCAWNFTGWNASYGGYGNATAIPVPADYDGDGKTDPAIKDSAGIWYIDYSSILGFGGWNFVQGGYIGSSQAVPGKYEVTRAPDDRRLDLAVKDTGGTWLVDLRGDEYDGWDVIPGTGSTQLHNPGRVLQDVTRPYIVATYVYGEGGQLLGGNPQETPIELTIGQRYVADVVLQPGTLYGWDGVTCKNGPGWDCASVELNPDLRVPEALAVVNPIGHSFTEIMPTPNAPAESICSSHAECRVANQGEGDCNASTARCNSHRRFAFTCTAPGHFALGFQIRDAPPYADVPGTVYNRDYGIRVRCSSPNIGLYGRVSYRGCSKATCGTGELDENDAVIDGVYRSGSTGVYQAQVSVPGYATVQTNWWGFWYIPEATGGPHKITVTAPGRSPAIAINVRVPAGSGIRVDTPLEETFSAARATGVEYTTYVDYARSRSIYHALSVDPAATTSRIDRTPILEQHDRVPGGIDCTSEYTGEENETTPKFETLVDTAATHGAVATINTMWWDPCDGEMVGYLFARDGYQSHEAVPWFTSTTFAEGRPVPPELFPAGSSPFFHITGQTSNQSFAIDVSPNDFSDPAGPWATALSNGAPIWDLDEDLESDVDFGFQIGNPPLVWPDEQGNTQVVASGHFLWMQPYLYDYGYARTAVGIGPGPAGSQRLHLVVADGEGVQGGNGPTANELGRFFKDHLLATKAIAVDSGFSTELVMQAENLVGASGLRHVNTITGEDGGIHLDPYNEILNEGAGIQGAVAGYLVVQPVVR